MECLTGPWGRPMPVLVMEGSPQEAMGAQSVLAQLNSHLMRERQRRQQERKLPNPQPRIRLSQENTEALVKSMADDSGAMSKFGGWYQALEGGHVFGRGEGIPWQKFGDGADGTVNAADVEVNNLVARVADTVQSRVDSIKGGAVLTDAKVTKLPGGSPRCSTWTRLRDRHDPAGRQGRCEHGPDDGDGLPRHQSHDARCPRPRGSHHDGRLLGVRLKGGCGYGAAKAGQHSGLMYASTRSMTASARALAAHAGSPLTPRSWRPCGLPTRKTSSSSSRLRRATPSSWPRLSTRGCSSASRTTPSSSS
jgi:hypothetical protein